jgi:hypothetical protein
MTAIHVSPRSVTALFTAAVAGIAAGGLTAYLQGVLDEDWNTIANSGAVWTVVAFLAAVALGRTPLTAALSGTLVLVGEVAGYYSYVSDVRHIAALRSAELLWTLAALWIGPLAGYAAFRARWGVASQRATALLGIAGVIAGEGAYLIRVAGVPGSGWVELAIGGAIAAWVLGRTPLAARARLAALGAGALTALAVYIVYRLPLLA